MAHEESSPSHSIDRISADGAPHPAQCTRTRGGGFSSHTRTPAALDWCCRRLRCLLAILGSLLTRARSHTYRRRSVTRQAARVASQQGSGRDTSVPQRSRRAVCRSRSSGKGCSRAVRRAATLCKSRSRVVSLGSTQRARKSKPVSSVRSSIMRCLQRECDVRQPCAQGYG